MSDMQNITRRQSCSFETLLKQLSETFAGIEVVYIFGSQASGTVTPDSDLDVAIFVEPAALNKDPMLDLRIANFLESRCNKATDVIIMNRANPVVQHEVLRSGHRVFEADPERRAKLELGVFKRYNDHCHFQNKRRKMALHGE